jgi:DNA-binding NarL/FixJ family response regulator
MSNITNILIADAHYLVRQGLRHVFDGKEEFKVVADTDDYQAAIALSLTYHPDVIIIGLNVLGANATDTIAYIMKNLPKQKILVLDSNENVSDIIQILKLGVHGYILKQCDGPEIIDAINVILRGKNFFCSNVLKLNNDEANCCGSEIDCKHAIINLSDREIEVLELISQGLTNKEIADKIFLSSHTIATHRKNLMKKFQAKNNVDLVISAIRENFIALSTSAS